MFLPFSTPLQARFAVLLLALFMGISAAFGATHTLPEIQRLVKQGHLPQALEQIEAYIASTPKDAQGLFLKGVILSDMNRPAAAITVFVQLTENFPELPEPYNNLAVLYAQQKQYELARAALEMAIRTHPGYAVAYENLGDIQVKLASQSYAQALKLNAKNASAQKKLRLSQELISSDLLKN